MKRNRRTGFSRTLPKTNNPKLLAQALFDPRTQRAMMDKLNRHLQDERVVSR